MESTHSYATIIEDQLMAVAAYYNFNSTISSRLLKTYQLLCSESLSGKMELPYGGLSRINSNGIPFQWSFSFGSTYEPSLRFICEAGTPYTSCYARFEHSLLLIDHLNTLLGIPNMGWFKDQVIPILMPVGSNWPKNWKSALWFAVGANKKGIAYKLYLNINTGEFKARWQKIGRLLTVLNRHELLKEWCYISSYVSENSIPVGIALDVLHNGECGRIKVYFRSEEVTLSWLSRWYRATNAERFEPTIRKLIEFYPYTNGKIYPEQSFFISWEAGKNEKATLKTELAVANFNFTEQDVVYKTYALLNELNLPYKEYKKLLRLIGYSEPYEINSNAHKFVGIGFENDNSFHLNTYIQPMISQLDKQPRVRKETLNKQSIDTSLRRAKQSLFISMDDEKKWSDYQLPVGTSDIWVTAFILFQLKNIPLTIDESRLYKNTQKWLQTKLKPTGWSYNDTTPCDSDSTSLGLLTTTLTEKKAINILNKLEALSRSKNGYNTYNSNIYEGRWSLATDDVSPYVLLAHQKYNFNLGAKPPDFIFNNQLKNGTWSSYWWTSDLYATYGYLLYFNSINRSPPRQNALTAHLEKYQATCVFEKALLINCLYLLDSKKTIGQLTYELVNNQKDNGLWNGSAFLRLPKDELSEPRNKIDGTSIFKDINGFLTTSMVINALSKY